MAIAKARLETGTFSSSVVGRPPAAAEAPASVPGHPALVALFATTTPHRLRKHQQISLDGPPSLLLVQAGQLATMLQIDGERRCIVELHFPDDVISSHHLAPYQLVALSQTNLRRVTMSAAERHFRADVGLVQALADDMERRAIIARRHCALLTRLTGEERLATFLLQMASRRGRCLSDRIAVPLPLSREDVADYLGLNADTVSRLFTRLKKAKVIQLQGRSELHILSWEQLRAMTPLGDAYFSPV